MRSAEFRFQGMPCQMSDRFPLCDPVALELRFEVLHIVQNGQRGGSEQFRIVDLFDDGFQVFRVEK